MQIYFCYMYYVYSYSRYKMLLHFRIRTRTKDTDSERRVRKSSFLISSFEVFYRLLLTNSSLFLNFCFDFLVHNVLFQETTFNTELLHILILKFSVWGIVATIWLATVATSASVSGPRGGLLLAALRMGGGCRPGGWLPGLDHRESNKRPLLYSPACVAGVNLIKFVIGNLSYTSCI